MPNSIRLSEVLKLMDQSIGPDGQEIPFSITFVKYSGEITQVDRGLKVGLAANMKKLMIKGVKCLDKGTTKTVNIFLITHFNATPVKW